MAGILASISQYGIYKLVDEKQHLPTGISAVFNGFEGSLLAAEQTRA
jgi:hypothetical protein